MEVQVFTPHHFAYLLQYLLQVSVLFVREGERERERERERETENDVRNDIACRECHVLASVDANAIFKGFERAKSKARATAALIANPLDCGAERVRVACIPVAWKRRALTKRPRRLCRWHRVRGGKSTETPVLEIERAKLRVLRRKRRRPRQRGVVVYCLDNAFKAMHLRGKRVARFEKLTSARYF